MNVSTLFGIIAALQHAEDVKNSFRASRGPCYNHAGYCSCRKGELCNLALARALKRDPGNLFKQWRRVEHILRGVIITRKRAAPGNRPRRYICLAEKWVHAVEEAAEHSWVALREKLGGG